MTRSISISIPAQRLALFGRLGPDEFEESEEPSIRGGCCRLLFVIGLEDRDLVMLDMSLSNGDVGSGAGDEGETLARGRDTLVGGWDTPGVGRGTLGGGGDALRIMTLGLEAC